MKPSVRLLALLLACAGAAGCRKEPARRSPTAARVPKGDVLWFTDPEAAADPALDAEAARVGAVAVFIPGGSVAGAPGPEAVSLVAPPPRALAAAPVVLVLEPQESLAASLASGEGPDGEALAAAVDSRLSPAVSGGAYGRVVGVHLDFDAAPRSSARTAVFVAALRRGLPAGTFVSLSLRALPPAEEDRRRAAVLYRAADALVSFVFGSGPHVDGIATDALGRPWWAAYDMRVVGAVLGASGQSRVPVPEKLLEPLSGSAHFQFENDLSVNDASVSAFTLTARAPVKEAGLSLDAGERIAFRVPSVSEMLFQLGSNLAGKRNALGRAIVFGGATEGERVFDLAALEDVLLGRSLAPMLEVTLKPAGRGAVAVDLANRSHHASVASRVDNWVEVDLAPAHPADVQLGGFDRYEVYDRSGRPVTPGRATAVRLFETLVSPLESVTPARIVVHGSLPPGCCPYRVHAVSAAGQEISSDWIQPPAPKTSPARRKK